MIGGEKCPDSTIVPAAEPLGRWEVGTCAERYPQTAQSRLGPFFTVDDLGCRRRHFMCEIC